MAINTDKNSYTILFAIGMVIIVGTLLAAIDSSLKEKIKTNKILEKQGVSWSEIVALSKILNIKMPSLPERMNLKSRCESILKEYPMVVAASEASGRYYYGQNWKGELLKAKNCKKMMADYVKLVDDNRECQKGLTK